ncbi:hypothetical protein [Sorangium sp. So ce1024]|uniref:hypothetical protein n=1 Tax=Sorangium sp. So ce1024 TaxID=3133327 RepID=UPI003F11227E
MRFAFFSSLISRSSISRSPTARSSLQGLFALSALVVLTGAKGQGCGSVVEQPQPLPEPDCGVGFRWEEVCSPCDLGEMCEMQCVPDDRCPRGWLEQTVCGGSTTVGQGGAAGGVGMPTDPGCWTECVPPPPMCPPGTVEQVMCGGSSTSSVTGGGWGSASVGAGGHGGGIGGSDAGVAPPPDMCWTECVPVGPYCPPGTREQTVCSGSSSVGVGGSGGWGGTGGSGGSGGWGGTGGSGGWGEGGSGGWGEGGSRDPVPPNPIGGCWTECVPVEPYCPPGTREQTVCSGSSSSGYGDGNFEAPTPGTSGTSGSGYGSGGAYPGGGCWTECIPIEPACPPNTLPATVCEDAMPGTSSSSGSGYGGSGGAYPGGGCWTECIPIEPYCPPGMTEQKVCSGAGTGTGTGGAGAAGAEGEAGGCWIECLEEPTCPPEAIVRTICEEPSGGGGFGPVCRTECVLMLP